MPPPKPYLSSLKLQERGEGMWDVLMDTLSVQEALLQETSTIFTSSRGRIEGNMAKRKQMPLWPLHGQPESRQPQPVHPVPPSQVPAAHPPPVGPHYLSGVEGQSQGGSLCAQ